MEPSDIFALASLKKLIYALAEARLGQHRHLISKYSALSTISNDAYLEALHDVTTDKLVAKYVRTLDIQDLLNSYQDESEPHNVYQLPDHVRHAIMASFRSFIIAHDLCPSYGLEEFQSWWLDLTLNWEEPTLITPMLLRVLSD